MSVRPGSLSCAWLAGWLAGGLAGWLRPREAQRGGAWIEQACHALGWRPQKAYVTHTCTHSRSQLVGMLRGGFGRFGNAWECFREAWGGLGRLREGLWEVLGKSLGEAWGGLGGLFCPCSASLGKLGRLGAAWGGLGNAWERFGEAWGMFGNASGGSGRLGEAWGRLGECFVNASGKAWGGMLGNSSGRLGPLWASASLPKGCFWSTCLRFDVFMVQPGRQPSA